MEWHNALAGVVLPCNWSCASLTPLGYLVADGQNLIIHEALKQQYDWVFLLEDDVIPPPNIFLKLAEYTERADVPIVSGLYRLKGSPNGEPLIYRGRGNGAFRDFKLGDKVWVDGVPTGCLLVHTSIFRELAKSRQTYDVLSCGTKVSLIRWFETPRSCFIDAATGGYVRLLGTSDLYFCDLLKEHDVLRKAGWPKIARKQYPYLVDTAIDCQHVDRETGRLW